MKTINNGSMKLEMVASYAFKDRNAIICKRAKGDYIVGKNYTMNGDETEVSWSWGCYDIPTSESAKKVALAWIFA